MENRKKIYLNSSYLKLQFIYAILHIWAINYYCCPIKNSHIIRTSSIYWNQPFLVTLLLPQNKYITIGKSTHFIGQPLYSQIIKLLDKLIFIEISRENGGEHYIKRFDSWTHLVVMLYAVIMRFDSLREISTSLQAEARKICHLGINMKTSRSTLSDANKRRPDAVFEAIYRDLLLLITLVFHRTAEMVRNLNR